MSKFFRDLPISPESEITDDTLVAVSFEDTIKTYKATITDLLLHLSRVNFIDKGIIGAPGTISSVPPGDNDTCYVSEDAYNEIPVGSILYVNVTDEVIVIDKFPSPPTDFVLKINGERDYTALRYSYRMPYVTFFTQEGDLVGIVNANGAFSNKFGSLTDEKDYISFSGSSEGVYINSDDVIQSTIDGSATRFELNSTGIIASADTEISESTNSNLVRTVDKSGIITTPRQSGIYYRMGSDQALSDDVATVVRFDRREYDIQDEFDTGSFAFRPSQAGIYSVTATIVLRTTWLSGDQIDLFVTRAPTLSEPVNVQTHSFSAPPSLPYFLSVSSIVQVDAYPTGYINVMVVANFIGLSRNLSASAAIDGSYRGYAGIQISKIA